MDHEAYRQIDAINWSTLRTIHRSPKHYLYALEHPPEETDDMRQGRLNHSTVFEPHTVAAKYAVWEGGRRYGKEWDAFCDLNRGLTIMQPADMEKAQNIAEAVWTHKHAARLLEAGKCEQVILWADKDTGLPCKARVDWLGDWGVDLKTTNDIEARAFGRHCSSFMYYGQVAFYNAGVYASGIEVPWAFIAVEKNPPHDVAVYTVEDDDMYAGEVKVQQALNLVAKCRECGEWPGQYPEPLRVQLPGWCWPTPGEQEEVLVEN